MPFFLMWSLEKYLVRNTEHKAPRYVVVSITVLPRLSWAEISFWTPYSRKPSPQVPPLMWATKFHTHRKQILIFTFLKSKPEDKRILHRLIATFRLFHRLKRFVTHRHVPFWSPDMTIYKVVQIWPRQTVTCLHTNRPGHIWTTLYIFFSAFTSKLILLAITQASVFLFIVCILPPNILIPSA
jgi:hypothetical protein